MMPNIPSKQENPLLHRNCLWVLNLPVILHASTNGFSKNNVKKQGQNSGMVILWLRMR